MNIYRVFCRTTGKSYIGQTIRSVEQRWKEHVRAAETGKDFALHVAIRKHGEENFELMVLSETQDLDELNRLEEKAIIDLNTMVPNGYNLKSGGDGKYFSADSCRKMSRSSSGVREPRTESTKRKISENMEGNQNHLGTHMSQDTIDAIRSRTYGGYSRARAARRWSGCAKPSPTKKISKDVLKKALVSRV